MEALEQVLETVNYVSFYEDFPGFIENFSDKINTFTKTLCCDFEINLKNEFRDDENLKNEILEFIKIKYKNIKVEFVPRPLPF